MACLHFWAVLLCLSAAQQAVNWPQGSLIKSGEHKLLSLTTQGPTQLSYSQIFFQTFSNVPQVAIGMIILSMNSAATPLGFSAIPTLPTLTGFTTVLSIYQNTTVSQLFFMYVAMDNTAGSLQTTFYVLRQNISLTASTLQLSLPTSPTLYDPTHKIVIEAYFTGFMITPVNSVYSLQTSGSLLDSQHVQLSIKTNCTLSYIEVMLIVVDQTSLQLGWLRFLDYGDYTSLNSGAQTSSSFAYPLNGYNYYNSMAGFTAISASSTMSLSILATGAGIATVTSYNLAVISLMNWRFRSCPTLRYYYLPYQTCYSLCSQISAQFANNNLYNNCLACTPGCTTCTAHPTGTTTICTDCPPANMRLLVATACVCIAGYFDAGVPLCSVCDYTCLTCVNSSSYCLSCNATRTINLTSSKCPCVDKTYDPATGSYLCLPCLYSCQTCATAPSNCTSCNATANRTLDSASGKCLCSSGSQEDPAMQAEQCVYIQLYCQLPCSTCATTATNCTSCGDNTMRVLTSNQCLCQPGFYQATPSNCSEICGDGISFYLSCDDANTLSGDGCSSACQIEANYTCQTTNRSLPSVCTSNLGYTLFVVSVQKQASANVLNVVLRIVPNPPQQTYARLQAAGLAAGLTVSSQSVNGDSLMLQLAYTQDLSAQSTVSVSLGVINLQTQFAAVSANRLALKAYSSTYYKLQQVEQILVYLYVGLLWLACTLLLCFNSNLLGAVVELFLYTGGVWLGVAGLWQTGVLLQPLLSLQYAFGYNLTLATSVFGVLNVGLLLNVTPLVVYAVCVCLRQRVSHEFKRMVLFDCSYSVLVLNAFMVVYGLSLSAQFGVTSSLAIGGVVFGGVYLVLLVVLSGVLFLRKDPEYQVNPKMQHLRANTLRGFLLPVYYLLVLSSCLAYLCSLSLTALNQLIMLPVLVGLLLAILFANLYINKVRHLLNLVSLICVYTLLLLYSQVDAADWTGMAVLMLAYLQLGFNCVFMYLQGRKFKLFNQVSRASSQVSSPRQPLQIPLESVDRQPHKFTIYSPRKSRGADKQPFSTVMKKDIYETMQKQFVTNFKEFPDHSPDNKLRTNRKLDQFRESYKMHRISNQEDSSAKDQHAEQQAEQASIEMQEVSQQDHEDSQEDRQRSQE